MNTITTAEAARKLDVEPSELNGYKYLATVGSAWQPESMWSYMAFTESEVATFGTLNGLREIV